MGDWRDQKKGRDEVARSTKSRPALQKSPINLLDPIGYDVPGAEGRADLYVMPGYDPTASIYFEDGRWVIHYAFPPDPFETHSVIETRSCLSPPRRSTKSSTPSPSMPYRRSDWHKHITPARRIITNG